MTHLTGDEPKIIGECCVCEQDIPEHEYKDSYNVYGDIVCKDCDYEYMKRYRMVGA